MLKTAYQKWILITIGLLALLFYFRHGASATTGEMPLSRVERRSFPVDVKAIGELEAARSTSVSSSIRGDQGKVIYLIGDGVNVKPGDILVKMDPTPFEEKLEKIKVELKEQTACVEGLKQALEWEQKQSEHDNNTAYFEVETAQLELEKIMYGDGPLEISRLKGAMQKAWLKYEELSSYSNDLLELEAQGYLNAAELKQAQKRLNEEKEAYETAKLQYESYINHVYPMQIKKAEAQLKRARAKQQEVIQAGGYKVGKVLVQLQQAEQTLQNYQTQLRECEKELAMTEITASTPGMVVLREDYRAGQRRKPRIGDIVVKNQPILDLPNLESMIVKAKVREIDLFKVNIGERATIEVDAYPKQMFSGTVASIGVLALSDLMRPSEEKYFEVRIALDNRDGCLRPGMTARALIHAQDVQKALTIPLHAVFDEQRRNYCYVKTARGYEKRAIEIGACNEHWAEIKAGLDEGEAVCLVNPLLEEEV